MKDVGSNHISCLGISSTKFQMTGLQYYMTGSCHY